MADDFDLTQSVGIDTQAWHAITAHRDRLKASTTHGHDRSLILGQAKELAESVARVVITERGDVAPANMDFCEAIESAHGVLERQPGSNLSQDPELRAVVQGAKKIVRGLAKDLAGFYDGLTASHEGVPAHLTAIGHSYGLLTTGLALQEPGNHGVTGAIFYGSPGIEATTPQELQLADGHVFTMQTPDDPIRHVYDTPWARAAVPLLPQPLESLAESALRTMDLTGAGQFGPNPATNPNFTHLETGAVTVPDGGSGSMDPGAAQGHSDYRRFGDNGIPRTTNYNIAAVIAGLGDDAIREN